MEQLIRTSIIRIFIMLMLVIGLNRAEQLQCQSKVLTKKDYGKSCSDHSECETGICSNLKCSCDNLFFYDNCSQTCIKNCNNSLYYSESSNQAAGLIVSADSEKSSWYKMSVANLRMAWLLFDTCVSKD
ncbi:hypothetical protein BgiBS90_007908 [Biomphalaria glabrata]|nr:hypothetical protein BgiBS90_007908 [Biomphalaria glabrata]